MFENIGETVFCILSTYKRADFNSKPTCITKVNYRKTTLKVRIRKVKIGKQ